MKKISLILVILCLFLFLIFSGCTGSDSDIEKTPAPTQTPLYTQTPAPTEEIIIKPVIMRGEGIPEEIGIETDAKTVQDNQAVLVYYTLDTQKSGISMGQEGWNIVVTAFVYNTDSVPADFSPKTNDDIINANIPYKSRNILLYPGTVYTDKIEVKDSPSGGSIDINKPYNYGILFRLQK
ncbi:hypothetical protein F1737_02710 [Methanoplanus sp. FWC-SCC4]|uniref:Uncharacterized protein n=1 Tax=Methanochimaera problematica TaxID=2609417 RepID=A0AA97I2J3_9EURY|nr:hypothetical protein [Methanoplanus sp. FWC-SCC4]WOF15673.1 hypothetical protein F1737_02710 [Methanoplanus sp. FWC-SCC4]